MNTTQRLTPSPALLNSPVIAVLRAQHAKEYAPVIEALLTGGVTHMELTLSTAGVWDELPRIIERFGTAAQIGVGTVTTTHEAVSCLEGGADFLVTPTTIPEVIELAVRAQVPVFPGGLTPTELHCGWSLGATAVKIFPASQVGSGYLADLRGPFPQILGIPSGGVTEAGAIEWLTAGATAVSMGGPLLRDAFAGGDLNALTFRAQTIMQKIHDHGFGAVHAANTTASEPGAGIRS